MGTDALSETSHETSAEATVSAVDVGVRAKEDATVVVSTLGAGRAEPADVTDIASPATGDVGTECHSADPTCIQEVASAADVEASAVFESPRRDSSKKKALSKKKTLKRQSKRRS